MKPFSRRRFLQTAALATTATPALRAASPTTLRVLCYNIHYGQGNDGVYDINRLAGVIRDAKPDLVGLQEVDVGVRRSGQVHQLRRLGEQTGLAARYGPTQHYEGGLFGNAVLTRLPILDVVIHPLPYTEATPERTTYPRGAIAVTVTAPDNQPLRFVSTHFQHNVPEDRVAEAKAINKLFANDNLRTVLAGDLNAKPDEEPIQVLSEHWTHALDPEAAPTVPSQNPKVRIDYILSRPAPSFRLVSSEVIPEAMASDHRPVLAVFELA
jgi:endonuclease/exonuclease/phosphatase family metal-dependent hydrolase